MKSFRLLLSCIIINLLILNCHGKNYNFNGDQIHNIGNKYSDWFYSSKLDSLLPKILDVHYKLSELKTFREKVRVQLGDENKLLNEQYGIEPYQYYYIRYSQFEKSDRPVKTVFTFNDDQRILQFSVETLPMEAQSRFLEYKVHTKLTLPFKGEWFVGWGGFNINENQHAVSIEQRFAYDFVIRKGSKTFQDFGKSNNNYYCYEQEVISPGDGIIVEVINNINDNKPGQMPEIHGNRVVIDHGNKEFSILAHFKKGSIVVKTNDNVIRGQLLGLTGNSGHSSEPHIHYHLQNTSDIENGEGLPIIFESYFSNGEFIKSGKPKIGEYLKNNKAN